MAKDRNGEGGGKAEGRLKRKAYDKALAKLHVELVRLQEWVKHKGLKVCIVFEGRDGAGKGGTIKAIRERVSPRIFRVVALPAPTEREKTQMYMQRYVRHFPSAGEIVIFDRSWYNRAGVERVMGFCSEEQSEQFLRAVPLLERAMVDSGIILIKYWLEVSPEEQQRRLEDRIDAFQAELQDRRLHGVEPSDPAPPYHRVPIRKPIVAQLRHVLRKFAVLRHDEPGVATFASSSAAVTESP